MTENEKVKPEGERLERSLVGSAMTVVATAADVATIATAAKVGYDVTKDKFKKK